MKAYKYPYYYDIAFSYRDIKVEVDFLDAIIQKFSLIPVERILELASGNSPYLPELVRRNYSYTGLDLNQEMIDYAANSTNNLGGDIQFTTQDMNDFQLAYRVDLVYVLLGSFYAKSNKECLQHFDRVADSLNQGGLYMLDEVVYFNLFDDKPSQWTMEKDGVEINVTYKPEIVDPTMQTHNEYLLFDVNDKGERKSIESRVLHKFYFPQEFLSLVEQNGKFEFIGWFDDFNIKRPATATGRQIVVLRKK
jgi:ubiquinone/menaquinone biosynthesis C-methylase UbiE